MSTIEVSDEAVEAGARAIARAETNLRSAFPQNWHGFAAHSRAALTAAAPIILQQERERAKARIEQAVRDELGNLPGPQPRGLDEWGPVCAGCGDEEFRIDGYCSIECRDRQNFAIDVLAALGEAGPIPAERSEAPQPKGIQ